jgi:hypothetical protein
MGHAPVAALYLIALWAGWRGGARHALVAGLALGGAVAIEHQAVLAGGAIGLWVVLRRWRRGDRWRGPGATIAGAVIGVLPVIGYNLVVFGTPFRVAYAGVVGWEGMHQGLFGLTWPRASALAAIVAGRKIGLIWVAPVLVLAPVGLVALARGRTRSLAWTCIAAALIALLVNAAYVYWEGGNTTGPRLAMPAAAPLAIGLAGAWAMLPGRGARRAAALLLVGSIMLNAAIASAEIFAPPTTAFPLWNWVLAGRFAGGELRTVASEWFGWSPWFGLAWWAALALPMLGWLVASVSRGVRA